MLSSLTLGLSFFLFVAGRADVVVVTLPARGDVTLGLTPAGRVELRRDITVTRVRIEIERPAPPSTLGKALNTYVAWAVSPEGACENLGEIAMDKDKGRLEATTRFEQAGVLITAEPHYMVDRPSSGVAYRTQNPRNEMRRVTVPVEVGVYDYSSIPVPAQAGVPIIVTESRVAFQIAKAIEADRFAEAEFRHARVALDTMEEMLGRAASYEIVAQMANETIRRAQIAVTTVREKKSTIELTNAVGEIAGLKQDKLNLDSRIQQMVQQQNAANAQMQKLQFDLTVTNRESQRVAQERDQAIALERATSRELSDLKKKLEEGQTRLVLQLRDEFFDLQASALTPAGREALARLCGVAEAVPGPVRLEGPAPDVVFEAARQYLVLAGIVQDRIILKR